MFGSLEQREHGPSHAHGAQQVDPEAGNEVLRSDLQGVEPCPDDAGVVHHDVEGTERLQGVERPIDGLVGGDVELDEANVGVPVGQLGRSFRPQLRVAGSKVDSPPRAANRRAVSKPRPLFAPVINAVVMCSRLRPSHHLDQARSNLGLPVPGTGDVRRA